LRRALEALFDVARHLLAKGLGVGSLECREVGRQTSANNLVTGDDVATAFVNMAGYRNRLTHHYDQVTPDELFAIIREHLGEVEAIAEALRGAAARLAG
jgi:uncharacterized protein YutE (UPF0331/DUF86 family)